jgi:inner membrane protein
VGECLLGRKLGNRALGWGALLGTLPDLDVILSGFFDTAGEMVLHRGASHSLLVMVAASFLLAPWFQKRWAREKVSRARAGWFVFLVWSTHVLIDCFTMYGTSVWWPFSETRVSLGNLFIIDPLFTLPMLVTLVWLAFLRSKKQQAKRFRLCVWGLGLSTLYAGLSFLAKEVASRGFDADLERRGVEVQRRIEAPTPFNIVLWRSVAEVEDELWVGYRTVFEGRESPIRWTVYPREREVAEAVADEREVRIIKWFSDGWWIARKEKTGVWLADLRFGERRVWGARPGTVDSRFGFAWLFTPGAEGDRLRQKPRETEGAKETLRRMGRRIVGDHEAWEDWPRLAGVPGALPELLGVVE